MAECNHAQRNLAMFSKRGASVGAGRPSAGSGRYEVYLGMGAEAIVVIVQLDLPCTSFSSQGSSADPAKQE